MALNSIDELIEILGNSRQDLRPLKKGELKEIEELNEQALPQVYRDFLLKMGKGAGRFMIGSSVFYDEIFKLYDGGNELLQENGLEELDSDAFVFWMHQGYQIAYFILGESENPNVYFYGEGKDMKSPEKQGTLLAFLEVQLEMSGISR